MEMIDKGNLLCIIGCASLLMTVVIQLGRTPDCVSTFFCQVFSFFCHLFFRDRHSR